MNKNSCSRCGECCRKGGPLLHKPDISLLISEDLAFSQILTLRAGELVHDPIYEKLLPLEREVLKIKGTQEKNYPWHCILHKEGGCSLHPLRPVQCQALFCADSSELENIYNKDRLSRFELFTLQIAGYNSAWFELAKAYEEQFNLIDFIALVKTLHENGSKSVFKSIEQEIFQQIRQDNIFRELCIEKGYVKAEELDFLFARPLYTFLHSLGIRILRNSGGLLEIEIFAQSAL